LPEETCIITCTRFGLIKKSLVSELPGPSSQAFVLVRVNEGDRLISVGLTDNKTKEILLATAQGMAIRFKEEEVRPMGLIAAGVNGMKLDDQDEVVGMEILPAEGEVLLLTNDGKAKRVGEKDFPRQGRYGKGVIAWELHEKERIVGLVTGKPNHMATIHLSKGAPKSARLDEVAVRKRAATRGDVVVDVKPGEEALSVNVGWTVEKFVEADSGKKNGRVKASANGRGPAARKKEARGTKVAAKAKSSSKRKAPVKARKPAAKPKASPKAKKSGSKKPAAKAKPALKKKK
jgi:DNA gyrase subunit A